MNTLKHTPGPWYITYQSNEVAKGLIRPTASIESDNSHIVTIIGKRYGPIVSEEETANARLIAAAPDMLQALQRIEVITNRFSIETMEIINSICKEGIDKATK